MVLWSDWLDNIASYMGANSTQTGILFSCLVTLGLVMVTLIATRGKGNMGVMIVGFGSLMFFIVAGWLPIWTLVLLVLAIVGLYTNTIRDMLGGKSN